MNIMVYCERPFINDKIAEPFVVSLKEDGSVSGAASGSWTLTDQSVYLHLNLSGTEYSGILCRMQDEAGAEVTVFSAVGSNESVWGVRYDR